MIVGVGIDVVPVERFAAALARTPRLAARLFTVEEQVTPGGAARTAESLARVLLRRRRCPRRSAAGGGMLWTTPKC